MYFEETDLQYRLSKIQLQAYVIPGPVIVHLQGASFGNNSALKRVYYFNSLLYFIQKHNSFLVAKIFAFLWIVFDFKTFIQKIIVGFKKNES
jgi:GT2 family glycosyltransferase